MVCFSHCCVGVEGEVLILKLGTAQDLGDVLV